LLSAVLVTSFNLLCARVRARHSVSPLPENHHPQTVTFRRPFFVPPPFFVPREKEKKSGTFKVLTKVSNSS
jgi:hypothetical protein